jgi:hypothetical protein
MHPAATFQPQLSKLADHAVPLGLPFDQKLPIPRFTAIMGKSQEIERFRSR